LRSLLDVGPPQQPVSSYKYPRRRIQVPRGEGAPADRVEFADKEGPADSTVV